MIISKYLNGNRYEQISERGVMRLISTVYMPNILLQLQFNSIYIMH